MPIILASGDKRDNQTTDDIPEEGYIESNEAVVEDKQGLFMEKLWFRFVIDENYNFYALFRSFHL